ncbi:hypothetical protein ACU635_43670 [[Actinomadura] parvosata]|uniref:hypothetical protein n=1 Tax=[Actinomadura] parvosata TaxID=1955412 RepID=UPI00406C42CD
MQQDAPEGQPEKKNDSTQIVVPNEALKTLVRLIAFIAFLGLVAFLAVNGFDPTVLLPFAPRP